MHDRLQSEGGSNLTLPGSGGAIHSQWDLNQIEQLFAKLEHLLRKVAARTQETAYATIGNLLRTYTAEECTNYFRNSGYERT